MKKGEIWLVNFEPSIGKEYQKVRPALVLQSSQIESQLVTVMPFSSQLETNQADDILVQTDSQNRLFSNSLLKVRQISSFDRVRFIHFVGILSADLLVSVDGYLKKHFQL